MTERSSANPRRPLLHSAEALVAAGLAAERDLDALIAVADRYAVSLTPGLVDLIDRDDPADPIARQFVADPRELHTLPHELPDPIGDKAHTPVEGVVHRYPDRVLLQPLKTCPVYCRFCFRRESVGPSANRKPGQMLSVKQLEAAIAYIAGNTNVWEVILTGGDPLALPPRRLSNLIERVSAIDHVKIIRIHTRVPVVDPERITPQLLAAMKVSGKKRSRKTQNSRKTLYVALHANHPREMTSTAKHACARIIDAGIPMVSQTVLLKGVNDNAATLETLMRAFVENRIKPYYLHHPDLAPGTSHFRVTIEEGQSLMRQLRGNLSGLAQPQYVIDIPGGHGKSPVNDSWVRRTSNQAYSIEDWRGGEHYYRDPASDSMSE